jgi:hypothetical protein
MKAIFTLILFTVGWTIAGAQDFRDLQDTSNEKGSKSFKERYFSAYGVSPLLDFGAGPGEVTYPAYRSNFADTTCFLHQATYFSLVSASYLGRLNILEPGDNLAISVKGKPTLCFSISKHGLCGFYFPIGLGLEIGNGATYKTLANMGFSFTAGYSLNVHPLFKLGDVYDKVKNYSNVEVKGSWGCPFVSAGLRYWTKTNKLREINILYGFKSNDDIPANAEQIGIDGDESLEQFQSSYIFALTWMIYMNY